MVALSVGCYWDGWPSSGGHTISVCNQPPRPTQPPTPCGWEMSIPSSCVTARCLNNKHNVFFVAEKACRNLAVFISEQPPKIFNTVLWSKKISGFLKLSPGLIPNIAFYLLKMCFFALKGRQCKPIKLKWKEYTCTCFLFCIVPR